MKILHLALASYYVVGMAYQENCLARQHLADGHDVTVIATEFYWDGPQIVRGEPCDKIVDSGVRLIRMPYVNPSRKFSHQKFRCVRGLFAQLESIAPDVIFSHGTCYWSVLDVIRYKKDHPEVKFYADTHTAAYNSGMNWLSLHVLHRIFYKYLTQRTLPYLEKYFYIGEGERQFSIQNYGVPESLMEFYPLGGTVLPEREYHAARAKHRTELGLAKGELLLVHSGKLAAVKRTDELLRAFAAVPELNAKLAVIGSIPEDRKALLTPLMEADKRVVFLGWKSGEELEEYLCACDLYCQPGGVSASMQNAVCAGCPIMASPVETYFKLYNYDNFLWVQTEEDIVEAFRRLHEDPALLKSLAEGSRRCARELLDYRKLAARLYQ